MFKNLTILQRLAIIFVLGTIGGAIAISTFFYQTSVVHVEETQKRTLIKLTRDIVDTALEDKKKLAVATAVALSFGLEQHLTAGHVAHGGGLARLQAIKRYFASRSDLNDVNYDIVGADGRVLISSWGSENRFFPDFQHLLTQRKATADLIHTSHGVRIRAISPMHDGQGHLLGLIAVYFGLKDVADQVKRKNNGDYLLVIKRNGQLIPAGDWFDHAAVSWIQQHPLKLGNQPELILTEDKALVQLPLKNDLYQLVILPGEEYWAPVERQKQIVLIDVIVVVVIDMIVNLIVLLTIYRDAVRPIKEAMVSMQAIADNRLDVALNTRADSKDMRTFVHQQEDMRQTLQRIVSDIRQHAEDLSKCSAHTYENVTQMCSLIKQNRAEASDLTQTATRLDEMAHQVADKAEAGVEEAKLSARFVVESSEAIGETARMLERLGRDIGSSVKDIAELVREIDRVSEVLETINDIAEQTNLLALNAAIEAARAGEHGRGFAVVADEVRALATKTQQTVDSVTQTTEMIQHKAANTQKRMDGISSEAEEAVSQSEKLQHELLKIREEVNKTARIMDEIAEIARAQNRAVVEAREQIEDIERQVDDMANRGAQTLGTFEKVKQMAQVLADLVGKFRI